MQTNSRAKRHPWLRAWRQVYRSLRWMDGLVALLALLVFVGVSVVAWQSSGPPARVSIKVMDTEYLYGLDKDQTLILQGTRGPSTIVIKGGEVHFQDSPCPDKLCVHSGWLKNAGQWAACLPNRIFIRIESEKESNLDVQTW